MKTEHNWRDVLLKAALIVEEGWCQGAMHLDKEGLECYRDNAVQSCAQGAIHRAINHLLPTQPWYGETALTQLRRTLTKLHYIPRIARWNDHPDRTATEVAEVMRQAATS